MASKDLGGDAEEWEDQVEMQFGEAAAPFSGGFTGRIPDDLESRDEKPLDVAALSQGMYAAAAAGELQEGSIDLDGEPERVPEERLRPVPASFYKFRRALLDPSSLRDLDKADWLLMHMNHEARILADKGSGHERYVW